MLFDMEAVRNLQAIDESLAGRERAHGAVIETRGDEVFIDGLAVTDRTLVELITRRLEREIAAEETVTDALAIGARVLDREATGAEVEAVRHELEARGRGGRAFLRGSRADDRGGPREAVRALPR